VQTKRDWEPPKAEAKCYITVQILTLMVGFLVAWQSHLRLSLSQDGAFHVATKVGASGGGVWLKIVAGKEAG